MHLRPRVPSLAVAAILAVAIVGCGSATASMAPTSAPSAADPAPSTSTEPVEPSASAGPAAGQTDTQWGRIWDAVPAGLPMYPGSTIADDASSEPVSARYAIIGADPAEVASVLQNELEAASFGTEGLSGPLEDGSFVLDSVGDGDCRIQTRVVPMARLIFVSVSYGAACPPA